MGAKGVGIKGTEAKEMGAREMGTKGTEAKGMGTKGIMRDN